MAKRLLMIWALAGAAFAQTATPDTKTSIPDFKVTASSLRQAQEKNPPVFASADAQKLWQSLQSRAGRNAETCFTMHSFKFSQGENPRLLGQSDCTAMTTNTLKRVR